MEGYVGGTSSLHSTADGKAHLASMSNDCVADDEEI